MFSILSFRNVCKQTNIEAEQTTALENQEETNQDGNQEETIYIIVEDSSTEKTNDVQTKNINNENLIVDPLLNATVRT